MTSLGEVNSLELEEDERSKYLLTCFVKEYFVQVQAADPVRVTPFLKVAYVERVTGHLAGRVSGSRSHDGGDYKCVRN